jgi:hypothetical protein
VRPSRINVLRRELILGTSSLKPNLPRVYIVGPISIRKTLDVLALSCGHFLLSTMDNSPHCQPDPYRHTERPAIRSSRHHTTGEHAHYLPVAQ